MDRLAGPYEILDCPDCGQLIVPFTKTKAPMKRWQARSPERGNGGRYSGRRDPARCGTLPKRQPRERAPD